jgi:hypothetical protein
MISFDSFQLVIKYRNSGCEVDCRREAGEALTKAARGIGAGAGSVLGGFGLESGLGFEDSGGCGGDISGSGEMWGVLHVN